MKYLYNNVNKIAKTWQANAKKVFIVEDWWKMATR
jgi:hypothetical protein